MKTGVLILLDILHLQGAEKIAVNIAVNLKRSGRFIPYVCVTRKGGILEKTLQDNNVEYIMLSRDRFYEIYKFKNAISLIRDNNIKLIHSHKIGSNLWGSLISRYMNIPLVSHYHGYAKSVGKTTQVVANKLIGKFSSEIITVSESLRNNLITNEGMEPSKITAIPNGIDFSKYQKAPDQALKESLGINSGAKVIGIVGALIKVKAHDIFLRAASEVLKRNNDVQFLLVGDGPERGRLQELADELGIRQKCVFLGFRQDIPNILSIVDIPVLSSNSEGLPLVLLEYMSASKPVVSTDVGGVSEVVKENINGFLVPNGDFKLMALKISDLINDPDLAGDMGARGLNMVKEKFSEKGMMDKIQKIYEKAINSRIS